MSDMNKQEKQKLNSSLDLPLEVPIDQAVTTFVATRKDLQLLRRLFHMLTGLCIVIIYHLTLSHQRAVFFLGLAASTLYLFEQLRINYPEFSGWFNRFSHVFYRAEEQLKESAMIPYLMGVLLTMISFPKEISLVAIMTLAVADPMSAIIGIRFGRIKVTKEKSLEGSLAFFVSVLLSSVWILLFLYQYPLKYVVGISLMTALFISIFELIPLRLDDNLTLPIVTALILKLNIWLWIPTL
jgi:dolichol kinase